MKTIQILSTLAVLATGTSFSFAQGGPPDGPPRDGQRRGLPPQVLEKFDKDGDGKLNEEERKAMRDEREAMRKKIMATYDTDGDGKLSADERKAMREAMMKRHKELLEKYDADKDGKLSSEERKAAVDAGEELPMMPMRGGPRGDRQGPRPDRKGPPPAPPENEEAAE
ncbi:EF-hand domain-containing protein [Haloferula sargassicola]|uniref:EF-hand domain-containing protein n=1 Tax=Haloferula sargassicola TaxID=490096 RepID=A0ABP9UWM9_9BACT